MKALCLERGVLALQDRPVPSTAAGEALVRVLMAGICNTDLELRRGYMGFSGVLGHELCGVVEAAPDSRLIGRRVAGEINLACGECSPCKQGLPRHCSTRTVMGILGKDGCFAEYVTLPLGNLQLIPERLSDELACFIEPTAAACEILEQVSVRPRDRVAVLGDGKLGLLSAQVLAATGCKLSLIGKHPRKLALAQARGIATLTHAEIEPRSFDVVVEATGTPEGLGLALKAARPRATIVLKSTYHGQVTLDLAPLVIDEQRIVGSRCGPFAPAIAALASGEVDPAAMVDTTLPLSRALAAFDAAAEPGALKVLLDMRG